MALLLMLLGRLHGSVDGSEFRCMYSGVNTAHKVTDLPAGAHCSFQVSACNFVGESELSQPTHLKLLLLPPPPPSNVVVQPDLTASAPSDS